MKRARIKTIIFLPYLRTINGIQIGQFQFKSIDDFQKESQPVKQELLRLASFFRQRETFQLDSFNYLILEDTELRLNKKITQLRKFLEIYRYLTLDPEGKGLKYEHTSIFVFFADASNPRKFPDSEEEHYYYKVTENFSRDEKFVTFPHSSQRPVFIYGIYSSSPPHFDEKLLNILLKKLSDNDLRAIAWYNKTFSVYSLDLKENLLKLSVAFETLIPVDEDTGRKETQAKISQLIETKLTSEELESFLKSIKLLLASSITKQISEEIFVRTQSQKIKGWFKNHFYSVGSGIRHGGEVSEIPKPVISKNKTGLSLWYSGGATHQFLNNVYFGKKLFKFLLEDKYFPYEELIKGLEIEWLEKLLLSDEERMVIIEKSIQGKKPGSISPKDIQLSFYFNGTYYGNKLSVFELLKRLLIELKFTSKRLWKKVEKHADLLINANIEESDLKSYQKFKPYFDAIIEIDSTMHNQENNVTSYTRNEMKKFYIMQFVSFALHRLI